MIIYFFIYLALSIILFFVTNWLGKHSFSFKYFYFTHLLKEEEALAFNFTFRVLSPLAYILILSVLFVQLNWDRLVEDIYLVGLIYVGIRLAALFILEKVQTTAWTRQVVQFTMIILGSIWLQKQILVDKRRFIPSVDNIANELWLILIIYLYTLYNSIKTDPEKSVNRRRKYYQQQHAKFESKYKHIIDREFTNNSLKPLIYSIMIHENFNRPPAIRSIERFSFKLTKRPHTLGIMQVRTDRLISDDESVLLACKKIKKDVVRIALDQKSDDNDFDYYRCIGGVLSEYNSEMEYAIEVQEIMSYINQSYVKIV